MFFCDASVTYSGNPDDGTGSSDEPGWAAAGGSDASIDSSLPTSALASGSPGCRLSLRSSSLSGGAEITGGGAPSRSFAAFTAGSPSRNIAQEKRPEGLRRSAIGPVSTGCGGISANGQAAVCLRGVLGHDGANAHDAAPDGQVAVCRLAVRRKIHPRFLVFLRPDRCDQGVPWRRSVD